MDPHKNPYPQPWEKSLNSFQKIVLLRCIRYDKVVPAIQDEVEGMFIGLEIYRLFVIFQLI